MLWRLRSQRVVIIIIIIIIKLVLITDRKSYMSFRLVLKSVTLNDLERRNGRYIA